ncbi:hypothetical protein RVBP17_1790 [Pseudomonas phage sp. 30-3]|uniref:Uncharacterized protein n=1 Tax=Pseudomonas phage vB_PaeM_PA5oct TaxID=2163605 RepID=A0A4Y5JUP2_9CAUD|nr:hypothetical protein PQE65_gp215 [Pseudomonas phage vB_PaeM_PA5oct]WMI31813.1 hypothetical protein GBBBJNDB_00110 [Pseudomonas phage Callisto]WPK38743.1 hypothetical protein Cassandra_0067 [Pseudomonas phage Cassandra]WPK39264.1 hypothetical protein Deiofobo_0067 [Pseudomonas phage Deifobo]WPK39776.1 hypothetical protein ETTORE_0067 [Pseudomonas phage Ettore]WPK40297.1 hypothetical protein Paride_0067 [Pseudomonas phage Paride]VOH54168.1 hypothetical protein MIJ3_00110 [Pseudomonas phage v
MTLPSSGSLSTQQINVELGNPQDARLDVNAAEMRILCGAATTGQVSIAGAYGRMPTGQYILTSAQLQAAPNAQYGYRVFATGSKINNIVFKGYNLTIVAWNDYDKVLGIGVDQTNAPTNLVTNFWSSVTGYLGAPTQYTSDLGGNTVYGWTWNGTNPFPVSSVQMVQIV